MPILPLPNAICPLCRRKTSRVQPAPGSAHARIEHALTLIEARLGEPLTVAMLAKAAGLSPMRFSLCFRQITGDSPHRFVVRRRLERAMALIADGTPPGKAAARAGFDDRAHFAKCFRDMTGKTPSWRRRWHRNTDDS